MSDAKLVTMRRGKVADNDIAIVREEWVDEWKVYGYKVVKDASEEAAAAAEAAAKEAAEAAAKAAAEAEAKAAAEAAAKAAAEAAGKS